MTKFFRASTVLAIALTAVTSSAFMARAEMMSYKATLNGATEVPANDSKGTGMAEVGYDSATKTLKWTVTYSGLTGEATAAHFHGPAEAGKNAGVAVPIAGKMSPMTGTMVLTDAQAADLMAGKYYVNVHTAMHKDGEIRGQVMTGK